MKTDGGRNWYQSNGKDKLSFPDKCSFAILNGHLNEKKSMELFHSSS
jgi:hypothetical protein